MKIRYKFIIGKIITLALLGLFCEILLRVATEVETCRTQVVQSNETLSMATSLRAQVRNQIVEAYEKFFMPELFALGGGSIEADHKESEARLAEYIKNSEAHSAGEQNDRSKVRSAESRSKLVESFKAVQGGLIEATKLFDAANLTAAKKKLAEVRQDAFNNKFLKIITEVVTAEESDMRLHEESLEKVVRYQREAIIWLSLAIIFSVITLDFLFVPSISKRLTKLDEATKEVAKGNLHITFADNGSDELSELAHSFVSMAQAIKSGQIRVSEQQMQLATAAKMSTLGEMAGGVAHEINTPLAVIQLRAEQLKEAAAEGGASNAFVSDSAEIITKTASRIARIVKGLRSFSRDGSKDPFERVSIRRIIEDTLDLCQERMKSSGVLLQLALPPESVCVDCRPTQISQVVLNLLTNANDAIETLPDRWIRLSVADTDKWVEICVTDCGNGIPKSVQKKLMQPFFTTKGIGKGTGLGLSMSRGMVQAHGGTIEVDDGCPNTRFVIRLPKDRSAETGEDIAA
jgi:signal transduction histidine kinase